MKNKQRKRLSYEAGAGRRVLSLVALATGSAGEPLCFGGLLKFAEQAPYFSDLTLRKIKRHVKSLVESGVLVNLGSFKGTARGRFLYGLPGTDTHGVAGRTLVRPHEIVLDAFEDVWNTHLAEAFDIGRLPKPVLTGDIYRHLRLKGHTFDDKRTLPNTLLRLTQLKNAPLRKLARSGEHFSAWVPAAVNDAEVFQGETYASDSERIQAAVSRAFARLGRPVCKKDVLEEIARDRSLELQSTGSLSVQLLGGAKDKGYILGKLVERNSRVAVRRAGQINGTAYYYVGSKADQAENAAYVSLFNLRRRWDEIAPDAQLELIEGCPLPTVAAGRALLVLADVESVRKGLEGVLENANLNEVAASEAAFLAAEAQRVIELAEEWISSSNIRNFNLPGTVNTAVPGLISDELLPLIAPFYPTIRNTNDSNRLVTLLDGDVRRVSNPDFTGRFGKNPREAAQFLFDRADALMMIAKQWGGPECSLQATLAAELGTLRDARFVIPALTSGSFDERLGAVACLAFLQDGEGNEKLRECMLKDPDPNIRQSAVWAYAFTQQPGTKRLLKQVSKSDRNDAVRKFSESIVETVYEDLWRV